MNKRWGSLLILAGLALLPIALQSGIASLKTMVSGNAIIQVRKQPRVIASLEFMDRNGMPVRLSDFNGRHVLLNVWATW